MLPMILQEIILSILKSFYNMTLVEIKDFDALIYDKPFFIQTVKNKQKAYEKLIEMSKKKQ